MRAGAIKEIDTRLGQLATQLPPLQERQKLDDELLAKTELQLATARQQATGKELDASQKAENEASAAQAGPTRPRWSRRSRTAKNPNSPENQ